MIRKPHCRLVAFNDTAALTPPRGQLTLRSQVGPSFSDETLRAVITEWEEAMAFADTVITRVETNVLSPARLEKLGITLPERQFE